MILGLGTPQYHLQELSPALTVTVQTQDWTTEELKQLATETAKAHGLNVNHFLGVINCESGFDPNAVGDNDTSFGIAQLRFPSRDWGIATSTAYDPKISLEIMANAWQKGEATKWSCFNILYGSGAT